jgi:CheY-like chemotaxis protein
MRVLVAIENRTERENIGRSIRNAGHDVEDVAELGTALEIIRHEAFDVFVMHWPPANGADVVRHARAYDHGHRTYVLALLERQPPSEIAAMMAAGVDDFARHPVSREELVARVEAPERIRAWPPAARAEAGDWSALLDAGAVRTFRQTGRIVADALAQMFGAFEIEEGWSTSLDGARTATVPLVLARDQVEVRVSLALTPWTMREAAGLLLDDRDACDAALDDVVRELANSAGGALKHAALEENVLVALGLPRNDPPTKATDEATRRWVARQPPNFEIGIVCEVCKRENQRVPASHLAEGMVVARDLKSRSGALIVAAGTRLTATTASRVARLLGNRFVVEVANAA